MINLLTNRNGLAKVSALPGKTQMINFFVINDDWSLVDLPGYGFAKVTKDRKFGFSELIRDYIERRENLAGVFVLIDSRLPPQRIDLEFLEWLDACGVQSFDSAGLALLLACRRAAQKRQQSLRVLGWTDSLRSLAQVYGVMPLLDPEAATAAAV